MSELAAPTLDTLADKIAEATTHLDLFQTVERLHGKFRIADLDTISFRTPAVFVSVPQATPVRLHHGGIRMSCQLALMLVTTSQDRDKTHLSLATDLVLLVNGNAWGLSDTGQPSKLNIVPIITGAEKRKRTLLTAVTWEQEFTLSKPALPTQAVTKAVDANSEEVFSQEAQNAST